MARLATGFLLLLHATGIAANPGYIHCDPDKEYPVPDNANGRMLFFIQRSLNSNTVVYDVNLNPQGRIEIDQPISIYWKRYNTNGAVKKLKWFEEFFAYGIRSKTVGNGEFVVYFSAYKTRKARLYLKRSYQAELEIVMSGRKARPYCAYVQLKDDNAFYPQVLHVDLWGIDSKTGDLLFERIENDDIPRRFSSDSR